MFRHRLRKLLPCTQQQARLMRAPILPACVLIFLVIATIIIVLAAL